MAEPAPGLSAEIDELAAGLDSLSGGSWAVPDLELALDLIQAFATRSAEAQDHSELKARLDRAVSDDEHPWSTYVQDVLICVDGGLAAASADDRPQGIWIEFALEPLVAILQDRDIDLIRMYGSRYWRREIIKDPVMAAALGFLHELVAKASQPASVDSREFRTLATEAGVLRPADS